MRTLVLLFLSLIIAITAPAQSFAAAPRMYVKSGCFWCSSEIIVDGKSLGTASFNSDQVTEAMKSNPKALELLEKGHANETWSSVFLWGGLGTSLTGVFLIPKSEGAGWALYAVGLISIFASVPFSIAALKRYNQAINVFNGVAPEEARFDFKLAPVQEGGVASLSWAF